ncbi:MAG: hypothetical protein H6667_00975 [Ardenticatenaceae bacterium]|nr:hypothetical protein [Ardenticatenaceae bacterium]MCB9444750.1 hypothetical protein [Ardenticatenaceae bacterium]
MNTDTSVKIPDSRQSQKRLVPTLYIVLGIIILLALAGLFIWGMVWLAQNQSDNIEAVRDIFIIALALESCLFGLVLLVMLVMIIRLVNMLEFEIKPILEKTNETVGMVRGTSTFVSQNVVKPVTKASSYVAGIRQGFKAFWGDPKKNLRD